MKPTPTEITIFAMHKDEPQLVYRNVVITVPRIGDTLYYKFKKRKYSGTVAKVSWDFKVDNPYVRVKVDLE
jgi:hypothetical protein